MKKQYIPPSIMLLAVDNHCDIMAGSSISVEVQNEEFDSENMTTMSRRNSSIWDDEE